MAKRIYRITPEHRAAIERWKKSPQRARLQAMAQNPDAQRRAKVERLGLEIQRDKAIETLKAGIQHELTSAGITWRVLTVNPYRRSAVLLDGANGKHYVRFFELMGQVALVRNVKGQIVFYRGKGQPVQYRNWIVAAYKQQLDMCLGDMDSLLADSYGSRYRAVAVSADISGKRAGTICARDLNADTESYVAQDFEDSDNDESERALYGPRGLRLVGKPRTAMLGDFDVSNWDSQAAQRSAHAEWVKRLHDNALAMRMKAFGGAGRVV